MRLVGAVMTSIGLALVAVVALEPGDQITLAAIVGSLLGGGLFATFWGGES